MRGIRLTHRHAFVAFSDAWLLLDRPGSGFISIDRENRSAEVVLNVQVQNLLLSVFASSLARKRCICQFRLSNANSNKLLFGVEE